jgi:hypothetical protein
VDWLFRPGTVILVSLSLVLAAGVLLFLPLGDAASASATSLKPLPQGDQEVVWLNAATSAVAWERFVAATRRLCAESSGELQLSAEADPFPSQTTAVPELAFSRVGRRGRIWIRWYKMTGEQGPREWVQAFLHRQPPPLAVIGGGSSDRARDLARELSSHRSDFASPPVFVITTATADQLDTEQSLMDIYAGWSFRFCFTDRQMAEAVSDFIWRRDDLRPDAAPIYMARWYDDPYAMDLFNQFHEILGPDGLGKSLEQSRQIKGLARRWAWLAGRSGAGGTPAGLEVEGLFADELQEPGPFWGARFAYSVGAFSQPNRYEMEAANSLIAELGQHPAQRRPLLVLPATAAPARRFLRALIRTAPYEAERFVIATGDAIDFNTIYRDRTLTWPIQDFPMPLVFFCHRNPVDPAGFQADRQIEPPDPMGRSSTGTHDLLLYRDIVQTLASSAYLDAALVPDSEAFRVSLNATDPETGQRRFADNGNQLSGTGEFVVSLRPVREAERVLPQARLQVWNWRTSSAGTREWVRVPIAGQPELLVPYTAGRPAATE